MTTPKVRIIVIVKVGKLMTHPDIPKKTTGIISVTCSPELAAKSAAAEAK
jgi:hypothetical protein